MVHPDDPRGPSKLPSYITSPKPKEKTLDKARKVIERLGYPERVATSDLYDEFGITDSGRMLHFLGYTPSVIRGQRGMRLWDAPPELDARFMAQINDEIAEVEIPDDASELIDEPEVPTFPVAHALAETEPIQFDPPLTDSESEAFQEAITETEPTPEEEAEVLESMESPIEEFVEVGPPVPEVIEVPKQIADDLQYIDTRDSWVPDMKTLLGEALDRMVRDRLEVLTAVGIEFEIRVWRK